MLDVEAARFRAIYPLGFKNHSEERNALDPTDGGSASTREAKIGQWPVFGMYQPDEMKSFRCVGQAFV